ncbi:hypothetical protein ACQEU3_10920 [Spirillospora sp. CA-253888]
MKKYGRIALSVLGSASLLTAAPASAETASSFYDESTNSPYAGAIRGTNLGNATLTAITSLGVLQTTCTSSQFDFQPVGITAFSFAGCTNNQGGITTVTTQNLPYSGVVVTHAPVVGGRDGTVSVPAPNPNVHLRLVMTLPNIGIPTLTCGYGLTTSTPLTAEWFNRTNVNRPVPSNPHAQMSMKSQVFQRLSTDTRCSPTLGLNVKYQMSAQPSGHDVRMGP